MDPPPSALPANHTNGHPHGGTAPGHDSGPVLALLARGLELWLRQQCEAIEAVEIHLEGSALKLLRGRLEGVRLSARGVVYQAMEMERVELRSNGLRVRMGPLLRHQSVELDHPFQIQGQVALSGAGLDRSLRSPRWQALGDELASGLLGASSLQALEIHHNQLRLTAAAPQPPGAAPAGQSRVVEVSIGAVAGTVELHSLDGVHTLRLPMDANIQIQSAHLHNGTLNLSGQASVLP